MKWVGGMWGLYPVTQTRQGLHLIASAQNPLTSNVLCIAKPSDTQKHGHNFKSSDISCSVESGDSYVGA